MVKVASIKNIIKDLTPRQQKTMRSHAQTPYIETHEINGKIDG